MVKLPLLYGIHAAGELPITQQYFYLLTGTHGGNTGHESLRDRIATEAIAPSEHC
jgi:hypothetical protein